MNDSKPQASRRSLGDPGLDTSTNFKVWYSVEGYDEKHSFIASTRGLRLNVGADPQTDLGRAEEAAEDFFNNQGGWECQWPKTVILYASENGPAVGSFEVRMDWSPNFYSEARKGTNK